MNGFIIALIVIAVIVLVIVFYVVGVYNKLVMVRNNVKDSWSQIDVLLKRRFDLIPNLIETVKGYAKHEQGTLQAVIEARGKALTASTREEEMKTNGELSNALSRLLAISENYPDLKANANFMSLQTNLTDTEDKIASARNMYNDSVLLYRNTLEVFPSNIIANMFKFKPEIFFEVKEEEKEVPKVQF